jgi:hypothetical protein
MVLKQICCPGFQAQPATELRAAGHAQLQLQQSTSLPPLYLISQAVGYSLSARKRGHWRRSLNS